jgi:hypothetical protein
MTYETLSIIVVINAVTTLFLWQKVAGKFGRRPKLKKRAATALWRSDPIIPKHDPPKKVGAEFSSLAADMDRLFFADFKDFADVMNWWLADEYVASRFRLQDLPAGDLSLNVDYSAGPSLGRAFAIYYNQTRVGKLEIRPGHEYSTALPNVFASVEVDWVRFFSFADITQFLDGIAVHVTTGQGSNEDYIKAGQSIQFALTRTLWDNYRVSQYDRDDGAQWGELTVSFSGLAFFYIDRRDARMRRAPR